MRSLAELERYRVRDQRAGAIVMAGGNVGDDTCGLFVVPSPTDRADVVIVASSDGGWDHVSVSRANRCPNWIEMECVAKLFFQPDETAMQLHVPEADHINNHPFCLHWWRPTDQPIPRPPAIMVGLGKEPLRDMADAKARLKHAGFL